MPFSSNPNPNIKISSIIYNQAPLLQDNYP